jgi:hypothetical protein
MKILHITPHLGGGVGTVVMDWMDKVTAANDHDHQIVCLDYANEKAKTWAWSEGFPLEEQVALRPQIAEFEIGHTDIVFIHFWDHPMLAELLSKPLPNCRMVFWCHKNIPYSQKELDYPDVWIDTSPIQGHGKYIWSTGNMERFLAIKPKSHKRFNVGYVGTVGYQKIHPHFIELCKEIQIPDIRFTIVGDITTGTVSQGEGLGRIYDSRFTFTGKVDDVAPYLAEMDVFGYPLHPDHYGTCEQSLGEAMSAGVVPVVMDNPAEKLILGEYRQNGFVCSTEKDYINAVSYLYEWNGDLVTSRNEMETNIRNRAKELYSFDTMISQWNDVFESMMEKPKTKRRPLL